MGTPAPQHRYAAMYDWAGLQIFNLVRDRFRPGKHTILDIGAGWGKYHFLLPDYTMDAIEIWEPNVKNEKLNNLYRHVFIEDMRNWTPGFYNVIIMGDVLEHISRSDAQALMEKLLPWCDEIYVVVPFRYPQHEVDGNPYEEHLQPDLTPKIMENEYPMLDCVALSDEKGIYIKR